VTIHQRPYLAPIFAGFGLLLALAACSSSEDSLRDAQITDITQTDKQVTASQLPDDEKSCFHDAVLKAAVSTGQTERQIVAPCLEQEESQRTAQTSQRAAQQAAADDQNRLKSALRWQLQSVNVQKADDNMVNVSYTFNVTNTDRAAIATFNGDAYIGDGQEFVKVPVEMLSDGTEIKSGQTIQLPASAAYDANEQAIVAQGVQQQPKSAVVVLHALTPANAHIFYQPSLLSVGGITITPAPSPSPQ
jgi:hypothetical protein